MFLVFVLYLAVAIVRECEGRHERCHDNQFHPAQYAYNPFLKHHKCFRDSMQDLHNNFHSLLHSFHPFSGQQPFSGVGFLQPRPHRHHHGSAYTWNRRWIPAPQNMVLVPLVNLHHTVETRHPLLVNFNKYGLPNENSATPFHVVLSHQLTNTESSTPTLQLINQHESGNEIVNNLNIRENSINQQNSAASNTSALDIRGIGHTETKQDVVQNSNKQDLSSNDVQVSLLVDHEYPPNVTEHLVLNDSSKNKLTNAPKLNETATENKGTIGHSVSTKLVVTETSTYSSELMPEKLISSYTLVTEDPSNVLPQGTLSGKLNVTNDPTRLDTKGNEEVFFKPTQIIDTIILEDSLLKSIDDYAFVNVSKTVSTNSNSSDLQENYNEHAPTSQAAGISEDAVTLNLGTGDDKMSYSADISKLNIYEHTHLTEINTLPSIDTINSRQFNASTPEAATLNFLENESVENLDLVSSIAKESVGTSNSFVVNRPDVVKESTVKALHTNATNNTLRVNDAQEASTRSVDMSIGHDFNFDSLMVPKVVQNVYILNSDALKDSMADDFSENGPNPLGTTANYVGQELRKVHVSDNLDSVVESSADQDAIEFNTMEPRMYFTTVYPLPKFHSNDQDIFYVHEDSVNGRSKNGLSFPKELGSSLKSEKEIDDVGISVNNITHDFSSRTSDSDGLSGTGIAVSSKYEIPMVFDGIQYTTENSPIAPPHQKADHQIMNSVEDSSFVYSNKDLQRSNPEDTNISHTDLDSTKTQITTPYVFDTEQKNSYLADVMERLTTIGFVNTQNKISDKSVDNTMSGGVTHFLNYVAAHSRDNFESLNQKIDHTTEMVLNHSTYYGNSKEQNNTMGITVRITPQNSSNIPFLKYNIDSTTHESILDNSTSIDKSSENLSDLFDSIDPTFKAATRDLTGSSGYSTTENFNVSESFKHVGIFKNNSHPAKRTEVMGPAETAFGGNESRISNEFVVLQQMSETSSDHTFYKNQPLQKWIDVDVIGFKDNISLGTTKSIFQDTTDNTIRKSDEESKLPDIHSEMIRKESDRNHETSVRFEDVRDINEEFNSNYTSVTTTTGRVFIMNEFMGKDHHLQNEMENELLVDSSYMKMGIRKHLNPISDSTYETLDNSSNLLKVVKDRPEIEGKIPSSNVLGYNETDVVSGFKMTFTEGNGSTSGAYDSTNLNSQYTYEDPFSDYYEPAIEIPDIILNYSDKTSNQNLQLLTNQSNKEDGSTSHRNKNVLEENTDMNNLCTTFSACTTGKCCLDNSPNSELKELEENIKFLNDSEPLLKNSMNISNNNSDGVVNLLVTTQNTSFNDNKHVDDVISAVKSLLIDGAATINPDKQRKKRSLGLTDTVSSISNEDAKSVKQSDAAAMLALLKQNAEGSIQSDDAYAGDEYSYEYDYKEDGAGELTLVDHRIDDREEVKELGDDYYENGSSILELISTNITRKYQ